MLVEAESTVIQWGAPSSSSSEQDRLWSRWPHRVCSVSSGKTMQPFHLSLTSSLLNFYQHAKSWLLSNETAFEEPVSTFTECRHNEYHNELCEYSIWSNFKTWISKTLKFNAWSHVNGMKQMQTNSWHIANMWHSWCSMTTKMANKASCNLYG